MALINQAVDALNLNKKLPKVITPTVHSVIDYAMIGTFILMGALFWKNNRRASIAAFGCAAAETTNVLLTDFPGGITDVISFETHGRIDGALAGATASLPNLLGFGDEPEAKYFRIQGLSIGAVTGMTEFTAKDRESVSSAA
jgi:hypothetical protein